MSALHPMRTATLNDISSVIQQTKPSSGNVLLVAVDGADGSGKTYFAAELAEVLNQRGLTAVVYSMDNFHNEKSIRYAKGRTSPLGFFEDSYNLPMLISRLLAPLKAGENIVLSKCFDCETDSESTQYADVSAVDVVIFEGLFLQREELRKYWDICIYLKTEFSISVARGNARFGLCLDPNHVSNERYVKGNQIYWERCKPFDQADIVVDNNDLERAVIIRSNKPMRSG